MPEETVKVYNANASHPVVLVCEHASAFIPTAFNQLGLEDTVAVSHIAWDPGASAVAHFLADGLDAALVESTVSRLVYDCNRPPESPTAVPQRSEIYEVPGNKDLSETSRYDRARDYYFPFKEALAQRLANHIGTPILVTIHSFTPVYHGQARDVEVGILHDTDQRLADAILNSADGFNVQRNQPYGPADGVTHTLVLHGLKNQILNVMIEIRNDLIATAASQKSMAMDLQRWIETALSALEPISTTQSKSGV